MKKIIDGHLYDTDLAKEVGSDSKWLDGDRSPTGGQCNVRETLYREIALKQGVDISQARKKTSWGGFPWGDDRIDPGRGAFFLVVGFGWCESDSSAIYPMTEDQARRWFERSHGDEVETYRRVFGDPSTCLPGYREETSREQELRSLRDELAAANAARQDAEARLSRVSEISTVPKED